MKTAGPLLRNSGFTITEFLSFRIWLGETIFSLNNTKKNHNFIVSFIIDYKVLIKKVYEQKSYAHKKHKLKKLFSIRLNEKLT